MMTDMDFAAALAGGTFLAVGWVTTWARKDKKLRDEIERSFYLMKKFEEEHASRQRAETMVITTQEDLEKVSAELYDLKVWKQKLIDPGVGNVSSLGEGITSLISSMNVWHRRKGRRFKAIEETCLGVFGKDNETHQKCLTAARIATEHIMAIERREFSDPDW